MKKGIFLFSNTYCRSLAGFLLCCLATAAVLGQTPTGILWQKCLGGTNKDVAKDVVRNTDGTIVVVGSTSSNDGDVSGNHGGATDAWVVKLDNDGNILWKKCIGGSGSDYFTTVRATTDNGYICIGNSNSNDGDIPAGSNYGQQDCFAVKLSKDGDIMWANVFGGSLADSAVDAVVTPDKNCIILASSYSNDGLLPNRRNPENPFTACIIKIDNDGNFIWRSWLDFTAGYSLAYKNNGLNVYFEGPWFPYYEAYEPTHYYKFWSPSLGSYQVYESSGSTGGPYYSEVPSSFFLPPGDDIADTVEAPMVGNIPAYSFAACRYANAGVRVSGWVTYPNWPSTCQQSYAYAGDYIINSTGCYENETGEQLSTIFAGPHAIDALPNGNLIVVGRNANTGISFAAARPGISFSTGGSTFNSAKISPDGEQYIIAGSTDATNPNATGNHGGTDCWLVKLAYQNKITGNIFIDRNNNGIQDPGEPGFDQVKIYVSATSYAVPDHGYFENTVATGTYTPTVVLNNNAYYTVPAISPVSFTNLGNVDTINIPVVPIPGITDAAIAVSATNTPVLGRTADYILSYTNNGTDTLNETVYLIKDSRTQFNKAVPSTSNISGDTLSWNISSLFPDSIVSIHLSLLLDIPPQLNNEDTLSLFAFVDSAGDEAPADNQFPLRQVVRASFDPNEKTENHGGYLTPLEATRDHLTYTIHFQNIGTAPAYSVYVKDVLDTSLDMSTLQMVASSHPCILSCKNGDLKWMFNNIVLMDSTTNDSLSRGYITYRIKPKSGFTPGDMVSNTAAVYFDYNPPIITNTEITVYRLDEAKWTGVVSIAWEDKRNWASGKVPDAGTDVHIEAGAPHNPVINSKAVCHKLYINPAATIIISSGSLDIGSYHFSE